MATFEELIDEITDKISQPYLGADPEKTTSRVAKAINSTIRYYAPERMWFNETTTSITLTVGNPIIPNVPSDLLYVLDDGGMAINFSNTRFPVRKVSIVQYDTQNYEGLGLPSIYKEVGGIHSLYFFPDQAYTLEMRYVRDYPDLVNVGDSNDWIIEAPRLVVSKTLQDLYLDSRQDGAGALYTSYIQKTQDEWNQLKDRNTPRISTGTLVTDQFITEDGFFNGYNNF